jgi:uncharacterized membrane protein (DUF106 family)
MQVNKGADKYRQIRPSGAFRDLVVIAIIFILVIAFSLFFNIFVFILELIKKNPGAIIYIDEVIVGLLTLSLGFAIFSWRRWLELKKEVAERIKIQEELVRIANTKAETERIISKQLHIEIEQRKRI